MLFATVETVAGDGVIGLGDWDMSHYIIAIVAVGYGEVDGEWEGLGDRWWSVNTLKPVFIYLLCPARKGL